MLQKIIAEICIGHLHSTFGTFKATFMSPMKALNNIFKELMSPTFSVKIIGEEIFCVTTPQDVLQSLSIL